MHALNHIPKRRWERDERSPLYLPRYDRHDRFEPLHRRRIHPPFNPLLVIGTPVALTPIAAGGANTQSVSLTLATGDLLVVSSGWNDSTKTLSTLTWNSISLTQDVAPQTVGSGKHCLHSLYVTSGATANLTITLSGTATMIVEPLKCTGLVSTSWTDKTAAAVTASTTSPSSGATATLSQAAELAIGAFYRIGSTVGGSWSNSFTDLHTSASGANGVNNTGYLVVASTAAVTAAKTGATNAAYSAICVTYKGSSATANVFGQSSLDGLSISGPGQFTRLS